VGVKGKAMAVEIDRTGVEVKGEASTVYGEPPRVVVPPAFYRDDEPPEPPEGDPHWREFPNFDNITGSHLLVAGVVACLLFAVFVHMLLLLAVSPTSF